MTIPAKQVRTDWVDPGDRIRLWEEWNASNLIGVRCSTVHEDLHLASDQSIVDGLTITDIRGTAHLVDHTDARRRMDSPRMLFMGVLLSGHAYYHGPDGTVLLRGGEGVSYVSNSRHIIGFDTDLHYSIVGVPAAILSEQWGGEATPRTSALSVSQLSTLAPLLRRLSAGEDPQPGLLADLVRSILVPDETGPAALHARAVQAVRAELHNPDFGPDRLATRLGISPRQLNRVFAEAGQTPARFILAERLDAARQDLRTRPDLSVTDIAMRRGFASPAHLARAHRRVHGTSPSDVRAA